MTKKNLAKTVTGLALVGCLGVGATLAYLSDQSSLTNNFTMSDKGINITLDEQLYKGDGRTESGNTYDELLPSQIVVKDPQVHVKANSVNANVFVKVENPNADLTILEFHKEAWQEIKTEGNATYYVYTAGVAPTEDGDNYSVVLSSTEDQHLTKVFEKVQVANLTTSTTFEPIKVYAVAVQADSVTDAQAKDAAMELFAEMAQ